MRTITQVGTSHYPECQVFRTLSPRLAVTDYAEEGSVIYQVNLHIATCN